jgi:hypothetical protein
MVIRLRRKKQSAWQQFVTAEASRTGPAAEWAIARKIKATLPKTFCFFTNLAFQNTYGLIQLPQNVTLTGIRGILARGNDIRRTAFITIKRGASQ